MRSVTATSEYEQVVQPLISVVVPVYRAEAYLKPCVDSLLKQTYENLEIILIDDGSPDSCGAICDAYAEKDTRVRVIHQKNCGVSAARNAGVRQAAGEYVAFVDADDWADTEYLAHMLQCAKDRKADLVVCRCETTRTIDDQLVELTGEEAVRELLYQKLFDTAPWSKLYRAEIVKEIPFPEGMFFEDLAVVCRMFGRAEKVVYSNQQMYHYRITPGSTMNSADVQKLRDELQAADMMYAYVREVWPQLEFAAACRRFSAYCQVLMKLPATGCDVERQKIWMVLKKDRAKVLRDRYARKKNRAAAVISYFGEGLMRGLWNRGR